MFQRSNRISELNGSLFQIEYHITEDDGWKWSKLKEIQIKKIENCLYIAPSKLNFSYKIEHSIRIRFRDVFTYTVIQIGIIVIVIKIVCNIILATIINFTFDFEVINDIVRRKKFMVFLGLLFDINMSRQVYVVKWAIWNLP